LFSTVRSACAEGDATACGRLAAVLDGLFRGADAELASTADAPLARATAQALLALAEQRPRSRYRS
jgi:hypothetical protein